MRSRCGLWAVGAAAYLAATIWLLLGADAWALNRLTVRLYVALRHVVPAGVLPEHYGVVLNVLLFMPLGWSLTRGFGWRSSAVLVAALLTSSGAELVQLRWFERQGELVDVLANGAGALLGSWLARRPREQSAHAPG